VTFFPSDHCYAPRFDWKLGYPHSLILIGAEADSPEIEYGWIEPGRVIAGSPTARLHPVSFLA
jgi:hypothetical protein